MEKEVTHTTTTTWPFWRVINYFYRTWTWTWNAMFFFGVSVANCGNILIIIKNIY